MIQSDNIWLLWSIIISIAAFSIYLENNFKFASKISGAIIALIIAMSLSNLGIIPIESVVYDTVWSYIVPISIPLLLFQCDLKQIYNESGRLLIIFLLSAIGTVIGTIVAYSLLKNSISSLNAVSAMMTASYIGGGVNFVAISTSLSVDPKLVSATIVSDNLLMAIYFVILMLIPNIEFFKKNFKSERNLENNILEKTANESSVQDIALSIAISVVIVTISFALSKFANKYLILTTISVLVATIFSKYLSKIKVANQLGTFLIYIFFVVIAVPASIGSIIKNSPLLLVFCFIIVLINLILTLIFAKIFNFSIEEAILASNANIGGPTTAVAMAISKSWNKYIAPIMLVGTLGYVIGSYLGLMIYRIL